MFRFDNRTEAHMSIRSKVTYPHVVSTLALLLAIGGTSYAAASLPAGSVGTTQIKNNAVTGAKVKNGSLRAADFAAGTLLRGPKGDPGVATALKTTMSAGVNLSLSGGTSTTIMTIAAVPAGTYVAMAKLDIVAFQGTDPNYYRCAIKADGTPVAGTTTHLAASTDEVGPMPMLGTITAAAPFTATVTCSHDLGTAVGQPYAESGALVLVPVTGVTTS
jgi:hypothetical protein